MGLAFLERWFLVAACSVASAWLVVPTWQTLAPLRTTYLTAVAVGIFLLAVSLDFIAKAISHRALLVTLTVSASVLAVASAVFFSMQFGQMAGIAAAALGGCTVCTFFARDENIARGISLPFAVVMGGLAFVNYIDSSWNAVGILIIPAAPLGALACLFGPLARAAGVRGGMAMAAALVVPLLVALALLYWGESSQGSWEVSLAGR
jgi:hypothetical protein